MTYPIHFALFPQMKTFRFPASNSFFAAPAERKRKEETRRCGYRRYLFSFSSSSYFFLLGTGCVYGQGWKQASSFFSSSFCVWKGKKAEKEALFPFFFLFCRRRSVCSGGKVFPIRNLQNGYREEQDCGSVYWQGQKGRKKKNPFSTEDQENKQNSFPFLLVAPLVDQPIACAVALSPQRQ